MIRPNDMEMMLQAYGLSFGIKDERKNYVDQYYRTHNWNGSSCEISEVIQQKEDAKNGK